MDWREFEVIYRDDMTGLLNKRFFNNAVRFTGDRDVHLIMFDIDDFKYVNDIHGHYAGDTVIREIGTMLGELAEREFFPIRYGGDEFIVIMPGETCPDEFMEHFRTSVQNRVITENSREIKVTCSFGCSTGSGKNIQALLKQADNALYLSKEKGKNCCSIFKGMVIEDPFYPSSIVRRMQSEMAKGRSVILSGTFCSGRSALASKSRPDRYGMKLIDLDIKPEYCEKALIMHNPAISASDRNRSQILYALKKDNAAVFHVRGLKKENIAEFLRMHGLAPTLFAVNHIDLVTSGNIGLVKEITESGNLFSVSAICSAEIDEMLYMLDEHITELVKKLLPAGLRFNTAVIRKLGIEQDIADTLCDYMLLEKRQNAYAYTFPPIYFRLKGRSLKCRDENYRDILKYGKILRNIDISNKEILTGTAEYLHNYGDLAISSQLLETCHSEKAQAIKAKIHIANSRYDEAENLLKFMNDEDRLYTNALIDIHRGKAVKCTENSTDTMLVRLSQLSRGDDCEAFTELYNKLKNRYLTDRQKLALMHANAFHLINRNEMSKGIRELTRAKNLCMRKHFIGDYAKIMMNIGLFEDTMGRRDKAVECLRTALAIFRLNSNAGSVRTASMNLAVIYTNIGDYSKAAGIYTQLLTMPDIEENLYYRAIILNNMADMYLRWWKAEEAAEYCGKAIDLFSRNGHVPQYVNILMSKISLAAGEELSQVDYSLSDDIIDRIDNTVIGIAGNGRQEHKYILESVMGIDIGKEMDYKHECLVYLALVFRQNEKLKKTLLEQAAMHFRSRGMKIRERRIRNLMEE